MEINTTQFEFAHGCKPRGYGMWAFVVTGTDGSGAYTSESYLITGKLTDARKEAARRLKQDCSRVKAIIEIEVLP